MAELLRQAGSSSVDTSGDPKPSYHDDVEEDFFYGTTVATSSMHVRNGFIRKVYSLLSLQLLMTTIVCGMSMYVKPLQMFLVSNGWLTIVLMIATIATILPLMWMRDRYPTASIYLLGLFTVLESLLIGQICAMYQAVGYGFMIFQAATATFVVFASLTAYCFYTKEDFSFLRGFLFAGLLGLLGVSLVQLIFSAIFGLQFKWFDVLVSLAGVLIFSGYILLDTSDMIHRFSPDEYIIATINLYLDIINLFLYILQFLSRRES